MPLWQMLRRSPGAARGRQTPSRSGDRHVATPYAPIRDRIVDEMLMCLHISQKMHSACLVELPGIEPATKIPLTCGNIEFKYAKRREPM